MGLRRIAFALLLIPALPAVTQDDFAAVEIKATDLGHGLHMLTGRGGNIVASAGDDGVFIVDDQYAPLTDRIVAALKVIDQRPVRFVVNTHWHTDHTGGNENLGKAGAVIVAHDNVRTRMGTDQFIVALKRAVPPSPHLALPVVTFSAAVTLHLNDETVQVTHVPHAHTDGDALVQFQGADLLHMGDVFWLGFYPFIDASSGGTIDGFIAGVERGIALAGDKTRIVPGHGPLGDKAALGAFRDMLVEARAQVAKLKSDGKTLEETIAAKPTAQWDATLGLGFTKPEQFVGYIYSTLP
jgi:glyoxylase-like metal-dependent hydrolase (beta-lactamase superfamily II)